MLSGDWGLPHIFPDRSLTNIFYINRTLPGTFPNLAIRELAMFNPGDNWNFQIGYNRMNRTYVASRKFSTGNT